MVEKKFAAVPNQSDVEAKRCPQAELDTQIADLRAEIARLTETVTAIGSGARAVVKSEAEVSDGTVARAGPRRADDHASGNRRGRPSSSAFWRGADDHRYVMTVFHSERRPVASFSYSAGFSVNCIPGIAVQIRGR